MALENYTDLLASIASTINRSDLAAVIPDFVAIAESEIAEDVRLREGVTVALLATVAGQDYVSLPDDWLEFVYIKCIGKPLIYAPPERIRDGYLKTGNLENFSTEGPHLLLSPTQADVLSLDVAYYARVPALATASTNWLLTKYPQIYLYKSIACAYRFLLNEEKARYWDGLYMEQVSKADSANNRAKSSGSPLTTRTRR